MAKSVEKKSSSLSNSPSRLLSPRDYSNTWNQQTFGLIIGDDSFLIDRFLVRLTQDALSQGYEVRHIDANDKQWLTHVKTILTSPSLFSRLQFATIKGLENKTAEEKSALTDILEKYRTRSSDLHMAFVSLPLPKNSNFLKWFNHCAITTTIEITDGRELTAWVNKELAREKLSVKSQKVVDAVIEVGESSPSKIFHIIEKLSLNYPLHHSLSLDELNSLYPPREKSDEFLLLSTILNGSLLDLHVSLADVFNKGKSAFALSGLISKTLQRYLIIRTASSDTMHSGEVQKLCGLSPYALSRHRQEAQKLSITFLKQVSTIFQQGDLLLRSRSLGEEESFRRICCTLQELSRRLD